MTATGCGAGPAHAPNSSTKDKIRLRARMGCCLANSTCTHLLRIVVIQSLSFAGPDRALLVSNIILSSSYTKTRNSFGSGRDGGGAHQFAGLDGAQGVAESIALRIFATELIEFD